MTTVTANKLRPGSQILSSLRRAFGSVGDALDTYVEHRLRNAVSQWEGQRSRRGINRFRATTNWR
jgi:hypothetical protein